MRSFSIAAPARPPRGPNVWTFARSLIWGLLLVAMALWGVLIAAR